ACRAGLPKSAARSPCWRSSRPRRRRVRRPTWRSRSSSPSTRERQPSMNLAKATRKYETWMAGHVSLIPADLREKHKVMRRDPFVFFRGTFYRWAQQWPQVCRDVADAPVVTAIGDLHVENFGTWRDAEGRLAWGINDFDECAPLPYTNDLVRLMASAMLAARRAKIHLPAPGICRAVLEGYFASLTGGGIPAGVDGR